MTWQFLQFSTTIICEDDMGIFTVISMMPVLFTVH